MAMLTGAKKKRRLFGQHFLRDQRIINLIAETAVAEATQAKCRALLEIGPGRGAITLPLQEALASQTQNASEAAPASVQSLILAEKDRELVSHWVNQQGKTPFSYRVASGDFVTLPESEWLTETPLAVASNLPYSAGTAILTRLARHTAEIPVMVLMFQAEVARRLRAEVGTKEWGSLSIWIQNRWDVNKLVGVPPKAFVPPPEVDSEVVILRRRSEPRVPVTDERLWETLLKVGFAHRRKMLRSGLPASGHWRNALVEAGLDGTKRAESLKWEEWQRFYQAAQRLAQEGYDHDR